MKKILLLLMFFVSLNLYCSEAVFIEDNIKYISKTEAESLYNVEIKLQERSGVVIINKNNDKIYMQLNNNVMSTGLGVNPFFLNNEKYKLKGVVNKFGLPILKEGELYLPCRALHDLVMGENEYDVIVVGSDPEGIAAAVSSSRMGAKVLIIGEESTPGGLLVHGMLNTIDMNWSDDGVLLTQGIFEEVYNSLGNTESFDIKKAEKVFTDLIVNEKNITYLPNMKSLTPIVEEKTIKGVGADFGSGEQKFWAKIIIDATKDGDVCAAAGVPYYVGMEDLNIHNEYMAVTLVFKVSGVDWGELKQDIIRYQQETGDMVSGINESSAWAFGKWCYDKYTPIYDNMKLRGLNIGRQDDGTILINALQILNVDGLNDEVIEEAKRQGAKELENVMRYLSTILNSFKYAKLEGVAEDLYIRETRHIKGEYTVSATEILEGVVFDDAIAAGSYPIDIQSTSVNNNGFVVGVPDVYTIPLRSSIPLEVENLFIVGKSASYSSVAAGSIRVVPVGMTVGEACGVASIYAIMNDLTPRELALNKEHVDKLQEILISKDVYLAQDRSETKIAETNYYDALCRMINLGIVGGGYNNDFNLTSELKSNEFVNILIKAKDRMGIKAAEDFNEKLAIYRDKKIDKNAIKLMILDAVSKENIEKAINEFDIIYSNYNLEDEILTREVAYQIIFDYLNLITKYYSVIDVVM